LPWHFTWYSLPVKINFGGRYGDVIDEVKLGESECENKVLASAKGAQSLNPGSCSSGWQEKRPLVLQTLICGTFWFSAAFDPALPIHPQLKTGIDP
jgi:hypothetical protein